jgi:hypothetical protein
MNNETLDEMTLTEVLREQAKDIKDIKDENRKLKQKIEERDQVIAQQKKQTENLVTDFETKFKNIQVNVPAIDTAPLQKETVKAYIEFRTAATKLLTEAFNKNRILVLPEDLGKFYFKMRLKQIGILGGLLLTIILCSWLGFRYLYLNSQNSTYNKVWYWDYIHKDTTGRKLMLDELQAFGQSDVNKARTDTIETFKQAGERKEKIKALHNEADSLEKIGDK